MWHSFAYQNENIFTWVYLDSNIILNYRVGMIINRNFFMYQVKISIYSYRIFNEKENLVLINKNDSGIITSILLVIPIFVLGSCLKIILRKFWNSPGEIIRASKNRKHLENDSLSWNSMTAKHLDKIMTYNLLSICFLSIFIH